MRNRYLFFGISCFIGKVLITSLLLASDNPLDVDNNEHSSLSRSPIVESIGNSVSEEENAPKSLLIHPEEMLSIEPEALKEMMGGVGGRMPTMTSRISYFLKYGWKGWEGAVRSGVTNYRAVFPSGNIGGHFPSGDYAEGQVWGRNLIKGLESSGIFNIYRSDVTNFIVLHEFAANGNEVKAGESYIKWEYSAKNFISNDAYNGIVNEISGWLTDKPQGSIAFINGGTAIDVGKTVTIEGVEKKVGETRGFALFSGDKEKFEFTKRRHSTIDGWGEAFEIKDTSGEPHLIPLGKLWPDNKEVMECITCRDALDPRSEEAVLYIFSALGLPDSDEIAPMRSEASKIIANMQLSSSSEVPAVLEGFKTGLFELKDDIYPYAQALGRLLQRGRDFFSISGYKVGEGIKKYHERASMVKLVFREGGTILFTDPRPVPSIMTGQKMDALITNMVKNQSPVSDPSYDPPKESGGSGDPIDNQLGGEFSENNTGNKIDEGIDHFGNEENVGV